jgi:hypothetical protein
VNNVLALETNAILAIAARECIRFSRSPASLFISLFMPVIFIGLLGGSLSQNLGGGLGYNFLQFVLLGMITVNLYQFSMAGVVSLIEFYSGKPAYHRIVLHSPALDFLVTAMFFVFFVVAGTLLFTRSERNR